MALSELTNPMAHAKTRPAPSIFLFATEIQIKARQMEQLLMAAIEADDDERPETRERTVLFMNLAEAVSKEIADLAERIEAIDGQSRTVC